MSQSQRKRVIKSSSQNNALEDNPESRETIEELTNRMVRFFITKTKANATIKRADIVKNVFREKPGKLYDAVYDNTVKTLKNIYGITIEIIDADSSNKKYVLQNCLPYADKIPKDYQTDMKSVIKFLVLTHIFMSNDNSTDIYLWKFLNELDIRPDTNLEGVGVIKGFINQTMLKEQYIIMEDRGGVHEDGEPKKCYKWGLKADNTVSKMGCLKFVSDVYERDVKSWNELYKEAKEQFAGCEEDR